MIRTADKRWGRGYAFAHERVMDFGGVLDYRERYLGVSGEVLGWRLMRR